MLLQLFWLGGPSLAQSAKPAQPTLTGQETTEELDQMHGVKFHPHVTPEHCDLGEWVVYGFHPHWMGSAWKSYNFNLLSHVSYFGYILNPETGGYNTIYDWKTTAMVDSAKAAGCKVDLCITSVSAKVPTRTMLNNPVAVDTCIKTLVRLVKFRDADGVTIDFEDIHSSDSSAFTSFVRKLRTALKEFKPDATVSVAGYALNGEKKFNLPALNQLVDYMVVMAYDYSYAGSKTAGAVAPMPGGSRAVNLQSTIDSYVKHGLSPEKLVLALPYYGYEWKTKGKQTERGDALGHGKAVLFKQMKELEAEGYAKKWDSLAGNTSYFEKRNGENYLQAWVPDSAAMALKFQLIKRNGIAGTGMWALGYDNGYHDLWNLLQTEFANCSRQMDTVSRPSVDSSEQTAMRQGETGEEQDKGAGWGIWILAGVLLIALLIFLVLRGRGKGQ